MNFPTTQLKDFIYLYKNYIPKELCNKAISSLSKRKLSKHGWNIGNSKSINHYKDKELDIVYADQVINKLLKDQVDKAIKKYEKKFSFLPGDLVFKSSHIRFNIYSQGQLMRPHHDHIYSLFDGDNCGIPILSVIMNLNNDYEGADLYFWQGFYKMYLDIGDIVIFPSNFMYPHGVTSCRKGIRYSAVVFYW